MRRVRHLLRFCAAVCEHGLWCLGFLILFATAVVWVPVGLSCLLLLDFWEATS